MTLKEKPWNSPVHHPMCTVVRTRHPSESVAPTRYSYLPSWCPCRHLWECLLPCVPGGRPWQQKWVPWGWAASLFCSRSDSVASAKERPRGMESSVSITASYKVPTVVPMYVHTSCFEDQAMNSFSHTSFFFQSMSSRWSGEKVPTTYSVPIFFFLLWKILYHSRLPLLTVLPTVPVRAPAERTVLATRSRSALTRGAPTGALALRDSECAASVRLIYSSTYIHT